MPHPTKLRAELENAKRHLKSRIGSLPLKNGVEEPEHTTSPQRPALSRLNTLLGKTTVASNSLSLFQHVGVPQRPTYDLIAERVLGPGVEVPASFLDRGSDYADHVSQRLLALRERLATTVELDEDVSEETYIGYIHDGTPVWSQVLNEQRGLLSGGLPDELTPPAVGEMHHPTRSFTIDTDWPKRMPWSSTSTFKQWFVAAENLEATQLCERVVDLPAGGFNPLYLRCAPQSGCSHLLHATGQGFLRRQEGHVLQITAADVEGVDGLDAKWQDALVGASALIVDDAHEFASHEVWNHQLGVMLDHALNLGVQVIVGGRLEVEAFRPSRLREVLSSATTAHITAPQSPTLMAFAKWRCTQKNLLLSDKHLAQLSRKEPRGWRAIEGRLERLSLAFEQGAVLLDRDDVFAIIDGPRTAAEPEEIRRVDDLASAIVGEAVDAVYASVEPGGIDLHSPLEPWPDDDYSPPAWDEQAIADETTRMEQRMRASVDPIEPGRPSVLDVHEREKYIIRANDPLNESDVRRTVDVLLELDDGIDERLNETTSRVVSSSLELHQLEERMVALAQRSVDADIEELITIADELRALEERLVEIDPDRKPLPPFDDESPSSDLDAYEPEGEWDIDANDVDASDLHDGEAERKLVRLSRIHPRTVLLGEEE